MRFSSFFNLKSGIRILDSSFEDLIEKISTKMGGSELLAFKEASSIKSSFKGFMYDMESSVDNFREIFEYFLNNCLSKTIYHFILLVADTNNTNFRNSFKKSILSSNNNKELLFEIMLYTVNSYRIKQHFLFCLKPRFVEEKLKYTYDVPKSEENINPIVEFAMDQAAISIKKIFWGIQDGVNFAVKSNQKSSASLKDNYDYLELFIFISDIFIKYCDRLFIDEKGNFENKDGLEMTDGEFIKNKILEIDSIPKGLLNRGKINSLFKKFLEDTYFQIQLFETNKKVGVKYYRVGFFDDIVYEKIAAYIKNSDRIDHFCNILLKMSLLNPELLNIPEEEIKYYIDHKVNIIQQTISSKTSILEKEILNKSNEKNDILQYDFESWRVDIQIQKSWDKVSRKLNKS